MASRRSEALTINELSDCPRVSKSALYKLAREGRVSWQKVGRHGRFPKDAIDAWLADRAAATNRKGGHD